MNRFNKYCSPIKHLTFEDRQAIAEGLSNKKSFKEIGRSLGKDCTTISKEVKKNYSLVQEGCYGHGYNNCRFAISCSKVSICEECRHPRSRKRCRFCNICNSVCEDYRPAVCHDLEKPPYVCNGCDKRARKCWIEKRLYIPKDADRKYQEILSESRCGFSLSEEEVTFLDQLISPLIKKGQSVHHIYEHHKDEIMISESTIYKIVDAGLFSARNIDLPRKVRFAPRRKPSEFKVEKSCRTGRTYTDFKNYLDENPGIPVVEIDSVIGVQGGKVLLTIHFVTTECMIAFIRDRNDAKSVVDIFNHLYDVLSPSVFKNLFQICLGDNGSEFSNPSAIEKALDGSERTRVFYCDASAPYQKGSAERNHEFIRCFVPKGKSFDNLTQEDVDLMMSHINSYSRASLGEKTPYEMMEFIYGKKVCDCFNLIRVPSDGVTLNNSIFTTKGEDKNEK